MRRNAVLASLAAIAGLTALTPVSSEAQSWGDRLKKKAEEAAKRKVEERTEKRAGEAADKALDKAECAASDKACQERAAAESAVTSGGAAAKAASAKPGEGAWANYDFKPGERILYADDFMKDEIGDFPRRMEFKEGALEIVEWQGQRFLRATQQSKFYVVLPEVLPERFTMEFDYALPAGEVWIAFTDKDDYAKRIEFSGVGAGGLKNPTKSVSAHGEYGDRDWERMRKARVLADGQYFKLYLDDKRVANVPNGDLPRSRKLLFYLDARPDKPALFGNFRVAAGGKKLYDALTEKGRVATQGIYFDTGSDRIRPESTPTLKEIGAMLTEHADLKLTIEGHTDNVGDAKANHDLSHRRAKAVAQYLVDKHGIEASRLQSTGFGDKKPAAPNTTSEGRQQNRRVELVKM